MHSPSLTRRLAGAALAAGAALLLAASPAAADSIAYVKDGNVWLSTSDGGRQYQVTSGGGYSFVSQADDGKMVALHGTKLHHLGRDGRLLADIATPVSQQAGADRVFYGPFDPAISPDGKRVAYTYYYQYTGYDPYCNPSNNCYVKQLYQGTAYTRPDRLTAWDEPGFQRQSGWVHPSWIPGEERVLLSDPSQALNEEFVVHNPGDSNGHTSFQRWFTEYEAESQRDGEIAPDRWGMATVAGDDSQWLHFYRLSERSTTQIPRGCGYRLDGPAGKYASPTWAPDSRGLAWAEDDGVHAMRLPAFGPNDCGTPEANMRMLIPGAKSPDWGPADVPPARQTPPPNPPGPPAPPAPQPPQPVPPKDRPAEARLSVSKAPLRKALSRGLTVRLTGAKAGRQRVTASVGRAKVGSGTARVAPNGTARVTVTFTKAARRALARRSTVKLRLTGAGARATVTLRR